MKFLASEWKILQQQVDNYEKWSLVIKLSSVAALIMLIHLSLSVFFGVSILAVLWLQEAIWKTYQARSEIRLLKIELALAQSSVADQKTCSMPFQFNSDFIATRASTSGLIKEYFIQALRPTVAFTYMLLISIFFIKTIS